MESLDKMLSDLKQAMVDSKIDLAGWNPRTVMGVMTRKRAAEAAVPNLTKKFFGEVSKNVVKVFLSGPTDAVTKAIEFIHKNRGIGVAADDFYRTLAKAVEPTMGTQRQFTGTQTVRLMEELADYARANGITELPIPKVSPHAFRAPVPTVDDTAKIIREAIRSTSEDDLNALHVERAALNLILATETIDDVIPVVVYGHTAEEADGLSKKVFLSQSSLFVDFSSKKALKDPVLFLKKTLSEKFPKPQSDNENESETK